MPLFKVLPLGFFLTKGAKHADAGEVFAGLREHGVETVLHAAVKRNRNQHDAEHDDAENRYDDGKYDRRLRINEKCHNQRAEDDERGTEQKPKRQVHAVLNLHRIACHSRN